MVLECPTRFLTSRYANKENTTVIATSRDSDVVGRRYTITTMLRQHQQITIPRQRLLLALPLVLKRAAVSREMLSGRPLGAVADEFETLPGAPMGGIMAAVKEDEVRVIDAKPPGLAAVVFKRPSAAMKRPAAALPKLEQPAKTQRLPQPAQTQKLPEAHAQATLAFSGHQPTWVASQRSIRPPRSIRLSPGIG